MRHLQSLGKSVYLIEGGSPVCFSRSLGNSRDKVAPATGILSSVIRLAMHLLDDHEIGRPESLDDVLRSVTPKVQRDPSTE
jgi:hypothetical protein